MLASHPRLDRGSSFLLKMDSRVRGNDKNGELVM